MKARGGNEKQRHSSITVSAAVLALLLVVVLLVVLVPARAYTVNGGTNTGGIEPNPYLEGNATVSTFNYGWGALRYSSTANITGHVDPVVHTPYLINPVGLQASGTLQGEKAAGQYWNSTTSISGGLGTQSEWNYIKSNLGAGSVVSGPTTATLNGLPAETFGFNVSSKGTSPQVIIQWQVQNANLVSANLQFDYLTFGVQVSAPALAGTVWGPEAGNVSAQGSQSNNLFGYTTATGVTARLGVTSGVTRTAAIASAGTYDLYYSVPASAITSTSINLNQSVSQALEWGIVIIPGSAATTTQYTVTVTSVAITTTPLLLGTTLWGGGGAGVNAKSTQVGLFFGNMNLSALAPTFTWASIVGGDYTVAIDQAATDLSNALATANPSAINVANATAGGPGYVEQITYSFTFGLPVAAQLSYSNFVLKDQVNISAAQYQSVSFGGTSYTTTYQALTQQKLTTIQSTVSASTAQVWFAVVYYTGGQWDSISSPPGLLTSNGLLFTWFTFLGVILALVGAGGASSYVVTQQRALKTRRGAVRLDFWNGPHRSLRRSRLGMAEFASPQKRHLALLILGGIIIGSGIIMLWSVLNGADVPGAAASFVGAFILLGVAALIAFGAYEIAHHYERHKHRSG